MAPPKRANDKKEKSPGATLDDAETQFAVGNILAAITLAQKAHEATGKGGDFELRSLNLLGTFMVESGDIELARDVFIEATKIDKDGTMDEKIGGGPEKFLLLAQLSEDGGQDSVTWFEKGAAALRSQIQTLSSSSRTPAQEQVYQEKQEKLGGVLCSVAEVYMTDLSWEEDAEQRCDALITEAMMIAPNSSETWQTVANVRISQERIPEAKDALKRSLELWQDLPPEHLAVPEFPTRIALTRLLLEVEMEDEALKVLDRLVMDDDQSVEAWYLGGWCLYIMGEKTRDGKAQNGGESSDDEWKAIWSQARKWLATSLKLYEVQEYEDERLGEHAMELFQSIEAELGELKEGEDDEWEGFSADEEDEDEEMEQ